jgi:Holliday junction resolvasome RuvABC DNA-binding subunit
MEKELANINHTLRDILTELRKLNKKSAERVVDEIKLELIDQMKNCSTRDKHEAN